MAVDPQTRRNLALSLQRLVSGDMTNDQFDHRCHGTWFSSEDPAVVEIATFGWSLYSSDLPLPYRLKGWYAVDDEERQVVERAVLFLHTRREYGWPTAPDAVVPYWCIWGPGFYLLIGILFSFIGAVSLMLGSGLSERIQGTAAETLGVLALLGPTYRWMVDRRRSPEQWKRFREAGDVTTWPFLNQADLEAARAETRRQEPLPLPPDT
jgi:hypothetical protein